MELLLLSIITLRRTYYLNSEKNRKKAHSQPQFCFFVFFWGGQRYFWRQRTNGGHNIVKW